MVTWKFTLPRNSDTYVRGILDRCNALIDVGIWEGIDRFRLRAWFQNFQGDDERYFAACLLDSLVYRSEFQTYALMEQLLQRCLPLGILKEAKRTNRRDWQECLSNPHRDPGVRLVPVIRPDDPPTKSATLLARLYRRAFGLSENWMVWPWQIEAEKKNGVKCFVFIDDFLGTGSQFQRFLTKFAVEQSLAGTRAVYAPLIAHESGRRLLDDQHPSIVVCSAETVDENYGMFGRQNRFFTDGVNTSASAKAFYRSLLNRRQLRIGQDYLYGFGGLALAIGFHHGTPNNSIPLIWWKTPDWQPLFDR
jgi:hypothetical protein